MIRWFIAEGEIDRLFRNQGMFGWMKEKLRKYELRNLEELISVILNVWPENTYRNDSKCLNEVGKDHKRDN